MCRHFGAFGGPFGGISQTYIVELEGPRGPFGTGKSSYMYRVATISLHLAVAGRFKGGFGQKEADFGPKLQILKWRSGTCNARSWLPPLSFRLILCVVVPHTRR